MTKTPLHLWIIGGITLLWHAFGAFDYYMTQTGNAAYLAQFSPEQKAYFEAYPAWAVAGWAFGVWFSTLGSLLLLLRSRFAQHAFWLSLAGSVLALVWAFGISPVSPAAMMGPMGIVITVAIYAIIIALILYSARMTRAGVLR